MAQGCAAKSSDLRHCFLSKVEIAFSPCVLSPAWMQVVEQRLGGYGHPALSPHTGHPVHKPAAEMNPEWIHSELPLQHHTQSGRPGQTLYCSTMPYQPASSGLSIIPKLQPCNFEIRLNTITRYDFMLFSDQKKATIPQSCSFKKHFGILLHFT